MSLKRERSSHDEDEKSQKRSKMNPNPLSDWTAFEHDLQMSAKWAVPTTSNRYSKGLVLAISFTRTDLQVEDDLKSFLDLMQTKFGFLGERLRLHDKAHFNNLSVIVRKKLNDMFNRHCPNNPSDPACAMIIYFSGHGVVDLTEPDRLILAGKLKLDQQNRTIPDGKFFTWKSVIIALLDLERDWPIDFLAILDCCTASLAAVSGTCEVIAASAWNTETGADTQTCFTRRLCEAIRVMGSRPFTACQLVEEMAWGPVRSPEDLKERFKQAMPVYAYHHRPPKASMLFSPVNQASAAAATATKYGTAKVCLEATLIDASTVPPKEAWQKWIVRMPPGISDLQVTVESVEPTHSVEIRAQVPWIVGQFLRFWSDTYRIDERPILPEIGSPPLNPQPIRQGVLPSSSEPHSKREPSPGSKKDDEDDEPSLSERTASQMNIRP